jgi:hypothetical protein
MSIFQTMIESYEFNRGRTLGLLDQIEGFGEPAAALGWRPGPGRAHIAWQLTHIGVTEELFATERLAPDKPGSFTELWPRFRGGSTPDDVIPAPAAIRQVLADGRAHLLDTLARFSAADLEVIPETLPEPLKQRKLTLRAILNIIAWHEAHHQGQAHITLNSYKLTLPNER